MTTSLTRAALLSGIVLVAAPALADEGMWTYHNPPLAQLKAKHGFEPTQEWLDKVRLASVRFMDGGSGSFVSPDGLMITNHHVGLGCIQNVSSAENDFVKTGFHAATREKETACPGYEVNVLTAMEDVTGRVQGAVKPQMSDAEAREARKAATAAIENECAARTKLRCNVVSLYQGGEYQLYQYRKYTDVRLVFAPEQSMAFFGGDPDNFTFPRHDLDICLMRAYEGGKPVVPASYLRWTAKGVSEGDLVFVSGHPGSTSRLETMARLEYLRDKALPFRLETFERRLAALRAYAELGEEQKRRALDEIFGDENSQKALRGYHAALLDPKVMAVKAAEEKALREKVAADPALAQRSATPGPPCRASREARPAGHGRSARRLRRIAAARDRRPDRPVRRRGQEAERQALREYRDANLDSLRNELFSPAPIHADLEAVTLADHARARARQARPGERVRQAALDGQAPREVAKADVAGTRLEDVALRQALVEGGAAAVAAHRLAHRAGAGIDPIDRETRRLVEDEVEAPTARWRRSPRPAGPYGRTVSPTPPAPCASPTARSRATAGHHARPVDHLPRALRPRAVARRPGPWACPRAEGEGARSTARRRSTSSRRTTSSAATRAARWSTATASSWASSSTATSRASPGTTPSRDEQARSVAVDARGIVEALRKIYGADALVDELTGR